MALRKRWHVRIRKKQGGGGGGEASDDRRDKLKDERD
jgi:hypothetical protein